MCNDTKSRDIFYQNKKKLEGLFFIGKKSFIEKTATTSIEEQQCGLDKTMKGKSTINQGSYSNQYNGH